MNDVPRKKVPALGDRPPLTVLDVISVVVAIGLLVAAFVSMLQNDGLSWEFVRIFSLMCMYAGISGIPDRRRKWAYRQAAALRTENDTATTPRISVPTTRQDKIFAGISWLMVAALAASFPIVYSSWSVVTIGAVITVPYLLAEWYLFGGKAKRHRPRSNQSRAVKQPADGYDDYQLLWLIGTVIFAAVAVVSFFRLGLDPDLLFIVGLSAVCLLSYLGRKWFLHKQAGSSPLSAS